MVSGVVREKITQDCDVNFDELAIMCDSQEKLLVKINRENELLTKELNTLNLAHETHQEDLDSF